LRRLEDYLVEAIGNDGAKDLLLSRRSVTVA